MNIHYNDPLETHLEKEWSLVFRVSRTNGRYNSESLHPLFFHRSNNIFGAIGEHRFSHIGCLPTKSNDHTINIVLKNLVDVCFLRNVSSDSRQVWVGQRLVSISATRALGDFEVRGVSEGIHKIWCKSQNSRSLYSQSEFKTRILPSESDHFVTLLQSLINTLRCRQTRSTKNCNCFHAQRRLTANSRKARAAPSNERGLKGLCRSNEEQGGENC